ncbi:MAG: vanadium-dependent haloperoxidase [Vicingaceae bacterium]
MQLFKLTSTIAFIALFVISCDKNSTQEKIVSVDDLHHWNITLEEAIVNDFFSPPVAARIYTYANIAAYEVLSQTDSSYKRFSSFYSDLNLPEPKAENIDQELASIFAFYHTGNRLVYSTNILKNEMDTFRLKLQKMKTDEQRISQSEKYGKLIADSIIAWSAKDMYRESRSFPKYNLVDQEDGWTPTPPDYADALEPHWSKIRAFTLDSAQQFRPEAPTKYDMDTSSQFYKELMTVYHAIENNDEERVSIAKFWDCNPLVMKHQGHVTFAEKKLTPGGHWENIARIAMKANNFGILESSYTYVMVSVALHEGFISCWDEKYHRNYIRPVTVIQKYIDEDWSPILYTPNFPEYPSGHSVVSSSAAFVLTKIFGNDFSYTDSTEVPYGTAPRSFNSFYEAADEAAISRMYGGIHFTPAIENGKEQGRKVGNHVYETLQLRK